MIYRITDWERFEHPEKTRRPKKGMPWHAHPTNLASKGATRLVRKGTEGYAALLVFERMVMLHAQRPIDKRDGRMLEADGTPMEPEDIADAILMPEQDVTPALDLLCDPKIGWVVYESVPIRTEPVQNSALQDRTGQDRNTPQPPKGGGGSAVADQEGKGPEAKAEDDSETRFETEPPRDEHPGQPSDLELALDAWDANRGGKMPPAKRPPDAATFRRWSKLGASPEEVADRARRASASAKWANPDRASPLTFHSLLAAGTWAEVGQLEAPAPKPIEDRGRQAMVAAEVAWRSGNDPEALRLAAIAEQYASTEDEARHLRQQIETPFKAERPEWAKEVGA